jgi:hypothetical protein
MGENELEEVTLGNELEEVTLGEKRVRTQFNLLKNDLVDEIKQKSAELINITQTLREDRTLEVQRLVDLSQKAYEEAAMWAVKAATHHD